MDMLAVRHVDLMIHVLLSQFFGHVAHCEEMNAGGDEGHHHKHHQRQAVDVIVDVDDKRTERHQPIERPVKRTSVGVVGMMLVFVAVIGRCRCDLLLAIGLVSVFCRVGMIVVGRSVTMVGCSVCMPRVVGMVMSRRDFTVMVSLGMTPMGRIPPSEQGNGAQHEAGADAADGDKAGGAGLASVRFGIDTLAPVAAEDFDHETHQRQQPRRSEEPLKRFAGRDVLLGSQGIKVWGCGMMDEVGEWMSLVTSHLGFRSTSNSFPND